MKPFKRDNLVGKIQKVSKRLYIVFIQKLFPSNKHSRKKVHIKKEKFSDFQFP